MARAKQTARAEARRRTRQTTREAELAELASADGDASEDGETSMAAAPATRSGRGAAGAARGVPRRPGLGSVFSSFGTAYRAPNIREDIRALPTLLLTRGFLAAIALTVIGAVAEIIYPGYSGSNLVFQFLTYPPALAPIFVAGFFAPRASYLLGLIVGIFDVLVLLVWAIAASPALGTAASPQAIASDLLPALVSNAVTGIVFGAGAAWYRRFLQSTSPRRQAQSKSQASRTQGGRRPAATANTGRRRY